MCYFVLKCWVFRGCSKCLMNLKFYFKILVVWFCWISVIIWNGLCLRSRLCNCVWKWIWFVWNLCSCVMNVMCLWLSVICCWWRLMMFRWNWMWFLKSCCVWRVWSKLIISLICWMCRCVWMVMMWLVMENMYEY